VDVLRSVAKTARSGNADVVAEALMRCVPLPDKLDLPRGLKVIDERLVSSPIEEREMISRDLKEWREAWGVFVRTQPGGQHKLSSFLSHVALGTTEQVSKEGIALLTVHSAKGMEFEVVFLIGMSDGTFPYYLAKSPSAKAEERRNAFVACTRSRRLLFLSYPKVKIMPWGDTRGVQQSVFFRELREALF